MIEKKHTSISCIRYNRRERAPEFSIIIPTFNRPSELYRCLNSVLNQSFTNFEIIVCDDASDLSYSHILNEIVDDRLSVIRLTINSGPAATRNAGLKIARGKYIAFLDDDDEYTANFLSLMHNTLSEPDQNVAMTWCNIRVLKSDANTMDEIIIGESTYTRSYPSKAVLEKKMLTIGIGYGTCFKAECLMDIGGFTEGLTTVEDTDLFLRFVFAGYVPQAIQYVGVIVHDHDQLKITSVKNTLLNIKECQALIDRYHEEFKSYPHLLKSLQAHIESCEKQLAGV